MAKPPHRSPPYRGSAICPRADPIAGHTCIALDRFLRPCDALLCARAFGIGPGAAAFLPGTLVFDAGYGTGCHRYAVLYIFPPAIAGHILAALILMTVYSGALYFSHALTGRRSSLVAVLLLPLLYSYVWNWGSQFSSESGPCFLGRRMVAVGAPAAHDRGSNLLRLFHSYLSQSRRSFCLVRHSGCVARSRPVPEHSGAEICRSLRALVLVAIQAVIPILLFLAWQRSLNFDGAIAACAYYPHALIDNLTPRPGHTGYRRLSTILRVEEGPAYWFDVATFAIQFWLSAFCSGAAKFRSRGPPGCFWALPCC